MAKKIYFGKCLNVITIIFIYCLVNSFCDCKLQQQQSLCTSANDGKEEANCEHRDNEAKVLSRKRRALTFPEGSSLQLGEWWIWGSYCVMHICVALFESENLKLNFLSHKRKIAMENCFLLCVSYRDDKSEKRRKRRGKMSMKFPLNKFLIELKESRERRWNKISRISW